MYGILRRMVSHIARVPLSTTWSAGAACRGVGRGEHRGLAQGHPSQQDGNRQVSRGHIVSEALASVSRLRDCKRPYQVTRMADCADWACTSCVQAEEDRPSSGQAGDGHPAADACADVGRQCGCCGCGQASFQPVPRRLPALRLERALGEGVEK